MIIPFSSYMASKWVPGKIQAVLDKYDRGTPSQAKVEEYMGKAGFAKNGDGFWAKDGQVLKMSVGAGGWLFPIPPILQQQLNDAGFDATVAVDPKWDANFQPGNTSLLVLVHCGSLSEPYDTLQDLHSKFYVDNGKPCPNVMGCSRYKNTEMDAILDQMEAIVADPDQNSKYMDLAAQAVDIYLRDMPEIMMTEEWHVITYDTKYWKDMPNASDPYVAPYHCCWSGHEPAPLAHAAHRRPVTDLHAHETPDGPPSVGASCPCHRTSTSQVTRVPLDQLAYLLERRAPAAPSAAAR